MHSYPFDEAVVVGRFSPVHNGHLPLFAEALRRAPRVTVILGSAFGARTPKNPFTWQERAAMIRECLTPEEAARIRFVPVRDYYNDARWVAAVRAAVGAEPGGRTALVGHFKDASSYYLSRFKDWELVSMPQAGNIDATTLRAIYFDEQAMPGALAMLATLAPMPVVQFLAGFRHLPAYAALLDYHQCVQANLKKYGKGPFVTVDALVCMQDHVLLIRRGQNIGKGQLALPGGLLDSGEHLLAAVIRELREETGFGVFEPTLVDALQEVRVFSHPGRSLSGHRISHVHFFNLGDRAPVEVHGNGQEGEPFWQHKSTLAKLEDQFFEDHFTINDGFFNLSV